MKLVIKIKIELNCLSGGLLAFHLQPLYRVCLAELGTS